ncbi:MAG TPA: hypothetical protein VFP32_02275 [Candidatus Saccharimonadales bacterium]|nr:hypothetical protein [Candidatus Saccharimonadales bacterium]
MRYSGKMLGLGHHVSVAGLVNLFLTFAELLLGLRVIVHFFFTTASGSWFDWVYYTTGVLLSPFRGTFVNPTFTPGHWYVDFPALFAMMVYAAFGALLIGLAGWNFGFRRTNR